MASALEQLALGLRQAGGVLSPSVSKSIAEEDQQNAMLQRQVQLAQYQQNLAAQREKVLADTVGPYLEKGDYQGAIAALGKSGAPGALNMALQLRKAEEDRSSRLQQASDALDARLVQADQLHEERMARLQSDQQRQAEQERHSREMEGYTRQRLALEKQRTDYNAPVGAGEAGGVDQVAKMIAEGRLAPLTSFALRSPWGQQVMKRVGEINPDYQGQEFAVKQAAEKAFTSGKQGNTVRSFNVALYHLDTLQNAADALGNGNIKKFNQLSQMIAEQSGQNAPTDFDSVKKIVADEIVKAIVGSGGGVTDRQEAAAVINRANSPAQLKSVIGRYKELMNGQLKGLRQQYEASTGKKDFNKFLTTESKSETGATPSQDAIDALIKKYAK